MPPTHFELDDDDELSHYCDRRKGGRHTTMQILVIKETYIACMEVAECMRPGARMDHSDDRI